MRNLNFNHYVLAFVDKPHIPKCFDQIPSWFSIPVVGPEQPLIFPHRKTGLRSAIILCTQTQRVLRFLGANMMINKRVPDSMFAEIRALSIDTQPEEWHADRYYPTQDNESTEYHRRWSQGEPFVNPSRDYLSVYKLFRRITVKAVPTQGIPHEDERPEQNCDTC